VQDSESGHVAFSSQDHPMFSTISATGRSTSELVLILPLNPPSRGAPAPRAVSRLEGAAP
jgi:hypothetical protein